ncbi:hypothetical protein M878_40245 [Streptomyces roseochromogenus subsp. oscitans DS 12.976]|uniref:Uncharacterized protein n=1 Tax=Streptomyces roseochromogenus subsp. oscitans DS 12.976 TaxID=1352936 RepID=V6JT26_STRRC|nr:hypothetical protein M878_40245 [Streptomyces roseochromogenus subsp. oscitans DS 12.976]
MQKPALLTGISRMYQPKDEEGEQLPPESTRVQVQAAHVLREMSASLTRLFDVTAAKDWANCAARAEVYYEDVPTPVCERGGGQQVRAGLRTGACDERKLTLKFSLKTRRQ